MVKIVNTLGDIKTGRQGEAVYQRKYGTQIRRTVSPKIAIASEAQLAHRDLYRAALSWRKGLSLANRRYLDGYCISNGIVDNYHIPLPWSRFALKLYLEKIKFIPMLEWIPGDLVDILDQDYSTGDDQDSTIFSDRFYAQTFIPAYTGQLPKLILKMYRVINTYDIVIEIRTTDGAGKPTAVILATQNFDITDLPLVPPGIWKEFIFTTPPNLTLGIKYAIVLHELRPTDGRHRFWRRDGTAPTYADGSMWYSDTIGVTWVEYATTDQMFKTYGMTAGEQVRGGILHVRHPALMSVIHKRGGLIIGGYDTLSSLDEQYLTGQVGLDVEAGDFIEAITLPGIKYCYEVS